MAAYTVQIGNTEERTVLDVVWTADHRIDLRLIFQGLFARPYYPKALAELGYET